MKKSVAKSAVKALPPVFPKTAHQFRQVADVAAKPKPAKRDKIFSKSRDTREDRGTREMKSSKNTQTFSHGK